MTETPTGQGVRQVTVDEEYSGQRVDNFLMRELKGVPRTLVYRIIRKGEVRVNRGRVQPSHKLSAGDVVRVPPVRSAIPGQPPSEASASRVLDYVLLEDDRLIVINKPSGLACHGGSGISFGLIELMRAARPDLQYLELVHRLDRDTSGCMLLAKRRSALRSLHEQLRESRIDKHYLALVKGHWDLGKRRVELPLATQTRSGGERHVTVHDEGKYALSTFRPVETSRAASLVEVKIGTGRTHQIRVHATALGHPIAGDTKYGDEVWNRETRKLGLKRLFLHATALTFEHPKTGESVLVTAPLPEELSLAMDRIMQTET
ncbi:MAG: RluA family pseudouridine synthase [Gammaproteobacteria bacterium]|jgi:23S rRNA pseudouridine955/2504/2580 synthase|nr:RluA family pseudouridine synthase [Gammaproteobacteria bacterium]